MLHRIPVCLLFALQYQPAMAGEVRLSPDYLVGTWSLSGSEGCGAERADYIAFHPNGTLEAGTGKVPQAAGFWELDYDTVLLHMLVSPRAADTGHPFYQSSYHYQYRAAQVTDTQPDTLQAIIGTQPAGEKHALTRCR